MPRERKLLGLVSLDRKSVIPSRVQWRVVASDGSSDAWQCSRLRRQAVKERVGLVFGDVLSRRQRDRCGNQIVRTETGVGLACANEAAYKQAGAGNEYQCHRHLGDDEDVADT